jgi:hypothetical protein
MQNELLHAPVQDFDREQHVLGGTRELVNPAELPEPFADYSSPILPRSCQTEDPECRAWPFEFFRAAALSRLGCLICYPALPDSG